MVSKLALSGLLAAGTVLGQCSKTTSGKWFDRTCAVENSTNDRQANIGRLGFVVVVLENTNKATALGTPYYQNLTQMGMLLNGYQGTTHPSQVRVVSPSLSDGADCCVAELYHDDYEYDCCRRL